MIKGLGGKTTGLKSTDALETALVKAYQAKPPAAVEESKYNPLAAPKIEEVIAKHGEKLRGGADDDVVIEAVAKTATGLLQQTKGGFMATTGSCVYVHTFWLIRLILEGRPCRKEETIFERFEADGEGKRKGYFEADDWLSAAKLEEAKRVNYNHSEKYDEARDTLGEIVFGGNGTDGFSIVCFIVEGRKYFVLFCGREDFVLVNEVTMDCLAYVAETVVPILLPEAADERERVAGFLDSDDLPRIKDILASKRDEIFNRIQFRGKWKAMTRFFEGYYADVLSEIADAGGTITEAPGRISAAADDGVPKQDRSKTEGGWNFDEGQVRNLILRLRGGGGGMCGGRDTGGGYGPDSDDDGGGGGPTGTGSSGGGGAKKKKRRTAGNMGADMGSGWTEEDYLDGGN